MNRRMPAPNEPDPVVEHFGSLGLSAARAIGDSTALGVLEWQDQLERVGVAPPLFLTHDLGLLLACPPERLVLLKQAASEAALPIPEQQRVGAYRALLTELHHSPAVERLRRLQLPAAALCAVLTRVLSATLRDLRPAATPTPKDARLFQRSEAELQHWFNAHPRAREFDALSRLLRRRLVLLATIDTLDLATLRLFATSDASSAPLPLTWIDLYTALTRSEAHDVADFSLEILPSVLEAKRRASSSVHSAFGYAGLSKRGSIDNLVASEWVWDEQELLRRFALDELLYYAHEQARDEVVRRHHLLIDASASMRGERATFARAMALAAGRKLLGLGEEVEVSFFDSRLYEPVTALRSALPVARVLSFVGERGRNPTRVIDNLAAALELAAAREQREHTVTLYTHAMFQVSREQLARVARLAKVSAVFLLPSTGELSLEYLDLLDRYWVVDERTIADHTRRSAEARRILNEVGPT